jgi:hypothetical protein
MTSLASSGVRRACSPPLLASSCGGSAAESPRSPLSSPLRVVETRATWGGGHWRPGICLATVGRVFGASEAKQLFLKVQGCAWGSRGLCLAAPHALLLSPELAAGHHLTSVHSLCHMLPLRAASRAPIGGTTCRAQKRQMRAALSGDVTAALSEVGAFLTAQPPSWAATLAVNGAIFSLGYPVLRSGLTSAGIASAFLLGVAAWKGFGPEGYAIVCLYFVLVRHAAATYAAYKSIGNCDGFNCPLESGWDLEKRTSPVDLPGGCFLTRWLHRIAFYYTPINVALLVLMCCNPHSCPLWSQLCSAS